MRLQSRSAWSAVIRRPDWGKDPFPRWLTHVTVRQRPPVLILWTFPEGCHCAHSIVAGCPQSVWSRTARRSFPRVAQALPTQDGKVYARAQTPEGETNWGLRREGSFINMYSPFLRTYFVPGAVLGSTEGRDESQPALPIPVTSVHECTLGWGWGGQTDRKTDSVLGYKT